MENILFSNLGRISYKKAWDMQELLFAETQAVKVRNRTNEVPEKTKHHLLFCEHNPVYTLGKSGKMQHVLLNEDALARRGIEFFKINRGGDITYHGPGQIVGYPILDLEYFFTDIHRYMRNLEEIMILTLADFGILAGRIEGLTGVWLDKDIPAKTRKICAFGVKCSRWVTMHGWALNVNTELDYFNFIIPCGITDKAVTSMQKELGRVVDMEEVSVKLKSNFAKVFGCNIVEAETHV